MITGTGAENRENMNKVSTKEYYSGILMEAHAIFNEYGVKDFQTALQVLTVREIQKASERQTELLESILDRLTAAERADDQSETEQPRRGRPRKEA